MQSDLKVHVIPGFQDNYFYLLEKPSTSECVAVDPGDAQPIRAYLSQLKLHLTAILLTHHHRDHTGGVEELVRLTKELTLFCSEWMKIPSEWGTAKINRLKTEHSSRIFILDTPVGAIDVRGHTLDHIAFVFFDRLNTAAPRDVFVGDALFGAGCGGLFEGSYEQMLDSLQRMRSMSGHVRLWCAHEYTLKNLRVAVELGENNPHQHQRLAKLEELVAQASLSPHEWMTVPLLLEEEIQTNPFLRWDQPGLQKAIDTFGSLETFTYVRKFRDRF